MDNQWNIYIDDMAVLADIPNELEPSTHVKIDEYSSETEKWAKMETDIYSRLVKHWPKSYTGMRLYTYYLPVKLTTQNQCNVEKIETKDRKTYTYVIGDCNERSIWQMFFEVGTNWDGGRLIFTLGSQQLDWISTAEKIYGIVQKLSQLEPIDKFHNELSDCHLLCYSIDAGLLIAKADIPRETILKILEDNALKNGFKLNIDIKEN
jgi:hypothetical protein